MKMMNIYLVRNKKICPIDIDTRKIRKIDTIEYPKDMETTPAFDKEPYSRLKEEFYRRRFCI